MIQLICLDFNGVIVFGSFVNISKDLSEKYDIPFQKVYEILYGYLERSAMNEFPEDKIFETGLRDLHITTEDVAELEERHIVYVSQRNEGAIAYAQQLRKDGYIVIGLSKNTPITFARSVKKSGVEKEFDAVINTYDLGLAKNSTELVEYLMKKYNVSTPSDIIIVDDQERNLGIPRKMGVHTILYEDVDQCKQEITAILT